MHGVLPRCLTLALFLAAGAPSAAGDDREAVDAAIRRSLAWLDRKLPGLPDASGTPVKPFVHAVAGLDFLLAGKRGLGGGDVERSRKYLGAFVDEVARREADAVQLPAAHGVFSSERLIQYTWPLAQAGVFFLELHARGLAREESEVVLGKIRRLLEAAQQADGGWGHGRIRVETTPPPKGEPAPTRVAGYPATLLAATNCVATTLGMMEAGFGAGTVSGLDRARTHYRGAAHADGSFPYDRRQRGQAGDGTCVARTGGALLAMHFLGVPPGDEGFARGRRLVLAKQECASEGHGSSMLDLAHTALLMKILGDEEWERFRAACFPRILARQSEEGELGCICERRFFGTTCDAPREGLPETFATTQRAYVTSLLALVLLLDADPPAVLRARPVPAPARGEATPRARPR